MNGRIYDPTLGRFLQADPHIQAPQNSQSYNRYSYVLNNPLSYTDPSGYFFDKLFKGINKLLGDFAPIVSIALTIWAPWGTGFWASVGTGAIAGGIATGSLRGALTGAFTAGVFHGIGTHFDGLADSAGVLSRGARIGKTLAHGIAGGISSVLNGGKFGHGFASAGFTQAFAGAIDGIGGRIGNVTSGSYFDTINRVKRIVAAAVVGGTASQITGGKFANGAITGAFSRGFNDESHFLQQAKSFSNKIMDALLYEKTVSLGLSLSVPSRVIDFVGGDSGGADLSFELGVVFRSNFLYPTDLGGYYTASASGGSSVPYKAGIKSPISKWGLAASLGVYGGELQDFAGPATFGSAGVVYGLEAVRSDSGVWGGETYVGGAASASMGRSNTHVLSIREGFIDSTCENVVC